MFRASLGQLKQHPRMLDFYADVKLQVPTDFIIGENFGLTFEYRHKREADRLHAPGDWVGIFAVDAEGDGEPRSRDYYASVTSESIAAREKSSLVSWCEVPLHRNSARIPVDRTLIKEQRPYRALYFVSATGPSKPLGESATFYPYFMSAEISVTGPANAKDRDSVRPNGTKRCARHHHSSTPPPLSLTPPTFSSVSIECGVSFVMKFEVGHSQGHLHCDKDTIGLVREGGETVRSFKLPADANHGSITIDFGCSTPGNYRLCYFAHEYNNRVCGESEQIVAVNDFGQHAEKLAKNIKNRQVSPRA